MKTKMSDLNVGEAWEVNKELYLRTPIGWLNFSTIPYRLISKERADFLKTQKGVCISKLIKSK